MMVGRAFMDATQREPDHLTSSETQQVSSLSSPQLREAIREILL